MDTVFADSEALDRDICRLIERRPQSGQLLRAFRPLLLEIQYLADTLDTDNHGFILDATRFAAGVSALLQNDHLPVNGPWQEVIPAMARAIGRGFPHFGPDLQHLADQALRGDVDCRAMLADAVNDDPRRLTTAATRCGVHPEALTMLLRMIRRMVLTRWARDIAGILTNHPWRRGYCPVCASHPGLAFLGDERMQWLHCPTCASEWPFPRRQCPHCDLVYSENRYLHNQQQRNESIFVCGGCRRYLVTLHRRDPIDEADPAATAISLAHLDLAAQQQGYTPMTYSDWNRF